MSGRKKVNPLQQWRSGWRADVLKFRDGKTCFQAPLQCPLRDRPLQENMQEDMPLSEAERAHVAAAQMWWETTCGSPKYVLAPMVAQSDKCFRLLCREEGVGLCYTPMYLADRVNAGVHDLELEIGVSADGTDRPLVCQLAGCSIQAVIEAGLRVQNTVDAIDLNFGCPQRCAEDAGVGAYFLEEYPDMACQMVEQLAAALRIPVLVKMRMHPSGVNETVRLAQRLQAAGASALTLHGRFRWQREHEGPADWSAIRAVKQALGIPVIANGSIQSLDDALQCLKYTEVDAVMSGTGLLRHPTLFTDATIRSPFCRDALHDSVDSRRASHKAAQQALRNCYRYISIVESNIDACYPDACKSVAVNGREVHDVVRDHLMAMLQIHIMDNSHHSLCSVLLSKAKCSSIDQFRAALDLIATELEITA